MGKILLTIEEYNKLYEKAVTFFYDEKELIKCEILKDKVHIEKNEKRYKCLKDVYKQTERKEKYYKENSIGTV